MFSSFFRHYERIGTLSEIATAMPCPSSTETEAVFDENSGYFSAYIAILIFVGISTVATWIFYTRVGAPGIALNVIYPIGFIFCIIGIAANSWISILIFVIGLCIDIFGAVMMTITLFMDKIPAELLEKFPFTPAINKIIFPFFATSQTVIVVVCCMFINLVHDKC